MARPFFAFFVPVFFIHVSAKYLFVNNLLEVIEDHNYTARYISSLIQIENKKDKTRKHDITLIRMELNKESKIFGLIANEVARHNSDNTVFIHASLNQIPQHRVHVSSVFIITTDITNEVSRCL